MVCPSCGTGVAVGAPCPACGFTPPAPAPAADQFGSPMPSGLTGYAPPPTSAQLYPEPAPAPAYPAPVPGYDPASVHGYAAPPQAGGYQATGYAPGYPAPAYPVGVPYNAYFAPADVGNGFSIAGIVLGVLAMVACPLILGLVAVSMAQRAHKRGERLWKVSLGVSITGLVVGIIGGIVVAVSTGVFS